MNRWKNAPADEMNSMWPHAPQFAAQGAVRKRVIGVIRGGAAEPYRRGRSAARCGYFGRFESESGEGGAVSQRLRGR